MTSSVARIPPAKIKAKFGTEFGLQPAMDFSQLLTIGAELYKSRLSMAQSHSKND